MTKEMKNFNKNFKKLEMLLLYRMLIASCINRWCFYIISKFFEKKRGKLGAKCYAIILFHIQIVICFNIVVCIFANVHLFPALSTILALPIFCGYVSSKH